ncbi:C-reactive protein-like [Engystomops pustulosus]|uniref:C-reactive protein-like n=1 Tax=Engystomops pustulosus TaxID=76066 RepID=UPI003AFA4797
MKILTLLLMVIVGCCAKENLQDASFLFYKSSDTSRVVLKPNITEPLINMTVCLEVYTDVVRRDSLFKLQANNYSKPHFHLYQIRDHYYITIDEDQVIYKTTKETMKWRKICVSWEYVTGVVHFWVNGNLFPRRVLNPGFLIYPDSLAVLGQSLASAGLGSYRGEPTFVGEIKNVNMWDRAPYTWETYGNIIDWRYVEYETYGAVILYL